MPPLRLPDSFLGEIIGISGLPVSRCGSPAVAGPTPAARAWRCGPAGTAVGSRRRSPRPRPRAARGGGEAAAALPAGRSCGWPGEAAAPAPPLPGSPRWQPLVTRGTAGRGGRAPPAPADYTSRRAPRRERRAREARRDAPVRPFEPTNREAARRGGGRGEREYACARAGGGGGRQAGGAGRARAERGGEARPGPGPAPAPPPPPHPARSSSGRWGGGDPHCTAGPASRDGAEAERAPRPGDGLPPPGLAAAAPQAQPLHGFASAPAGFGPPSGLWPFSHSLPFPSQPVASSASRRASPGPGCESDRACDASVLPDSAAAAAGRKPSRGRCVEQRRELVQYENGIFNGFLTKARAGPHAVGEAPALLGRRLSADEIAEQRC